MNNTTPKRERNKELTQQLLIDATIEILKNDGFSSLGINAIAEKSNVNKVLIYRYFGGLPGLLKAVASELDLTQTKLIDLSIPASVNKTDLESLLQNGFRLIHESLLQDSLAMEIMIQEFSEENELTQSFAEEREKQGLATTEKFRQLISSLSSHPPSETIDIEAALAIASAGIYYLTLRSRTVQMFNGVDIQSKEGWDRICVTMAAILDKSMKNL